MSISLNAVWTDATAWDKFVDEHEQGRFCHLFSYGDVVSCYGYKPIRIAFLKHGDLVGVLPVALVNSVLFGRKMVSQPFSEYGGPLVDPTLDSADIASMYDLLDAYLTTERKIRVLEMHGDHGIAPHLRQNRFAQRNPHHVAILTLDRPVEEIWQKVVQYSVRKGVNKARGNSVTAFEDCSEEVIRQRFFPLYLSSMKRLGVPPHSIAYYLRCFEYFGSRMKIFWASKDGEILAGLLGFVSGNRVNIVNIVSKASAWSMAPNDLIHWEFIKWAAEAGLKFFDFGSVRYDGQRTYKKKWGATFEEHSYFFLSRNPAKVAQSTFNSSSSRMTDLAKVWAGYVPEAVAELVGPLIRKQLVR